MTSASFLIAAALTVSDPAGQLPARSVADMSGEQVILSCDSPYELQHQAALRPVSGSDGDPGHSSLLLVRLGDVLAVRETLERESGTVSRTVQAEHLSGDTASQFYHLEYEQAGQPTHLFFTINADQSGQLLWATADSSVETLCTAG